MKTTAEVAEYLCLSRRRIIQAAVMLSIPKFGRDYMFTDYDIEAIRDRIGKRGRPSMQNIA